MINLKEIRYISERELGMIKSFQKRFFKHEERPDVDDIKVFLVWNEIFNHQNLSILIKWKNTRYKREFLTDEQIAEWFEFYYN